MSNKNKVLTSVLLGVLSVLLVYFIAVGFSTFGGVLAKQSMLNANYEMIKEEQFENGFNVGELDMVLNWNEFKEHVVVQFGTYNNSLRNHSKFFHVFEKAPTGLNYSGILEYSEWCVVGSGSSLRFISAENTLENKENYEYCWTILLHDFENIFIGKVYNVNGICVSDYNTPSWCVHNWLYGGEPYLINDALNYVADYRINLFNAIEYGPKLINEIYNKELTKDMYLWFKTGLTDYFSAYSFEEESYVNFSFKCKVCYNNLRTDSFILNNLNEMYDAVKEYAYVGVV